MKKQSFLLTVARNRDKDALVLTPDMIVMKISSSMNKLIQVINDDIMASAEEFYFFAQFAQDVYYHKNAVSETVKEASEYADASEYYTETLREMSTMITAAIDERFGNLVNEGIVQTIVTFASEHDGLTKKKIKKHLKTLLPQPRTKTTKKGRK
jgi:hypothetical protein